MVNGCDPATAEDHTADSSVTIMFPVGGLKYSPACIKIAKGSSVTFSGSFMNHPLSGGTSGTPDASSPITHTMTGTSADFTFSEAGTFPYYCDFHFSSGMEGAIFVE
jgi:plastocyanin